MDSVKGLKLFLTGRPGCGKSSVIQKVIQRLKARGLRVGGIITPEMRKGGSRVAFMVKDVHSGKEGVLASVWQEAGPKVSKYRVNVEEFERVAIPALDFASKECDVVVLDEIGKMELFSPGFRSKVYELMRSESVLIATLHRNYVEEFGRFGQVIVVTPENRDKLPKSIIDRVLQALGGAEPAK